MDVLSDRDTLVAQAWVWCDAVLHARVIASQAQHRELRCHRNTRKVDRDGIRGSEWNTKALVHGLVYEAVGCAVMCS